MWLGTEYELVAREPALEILVLVDTQWNLLDHCATEGTIVINTTGQFFLAAVLAHYALNS